MTRSPLFVPTLLAALVAGCVQPDPAPRFTPAWEPFDPSGEDWLSTKKVLVVSDCQFHNLYSLPIPERNLSTEAAVATAIRPPQLDLFSRDVLQWILHEGAPDAEAVIHLGDALDFACEGEFIEFLDVMDASGRPWFMAPGNHDCYYLGNFDPQRRSLWNDACNGAGRPLRKDDFIRFYVAALARRPNADGVALAAALGLTEHVGEPLDQLAERIPAGFEWERPQGEADLLEGLWWSIDRGRPWRSYVLQSVDIARPGMQEEFPSRIVLLDSCQYTRRPEVIPNAWKAYPVPMNSGNGGEMLPDQLRKVRSWVEERGAATLAFHHPFDSLAPRSRASIGWLRRERPANLVISGHTHRGYFGYQDVGGETAELELNIASTTDWPMEWRILSGWANPETRQEYISAERHTLVEELSNREGFFLRGWEIPIDAPDDYRRYKQGESSSGLFIDYYIAYHLVPYWFRQPKVSASKPARRTEAQVKDTLLWTYDRLVTEFPTDPEAASTIWPDGCRTDADVRQRLEATAGLDSLEHKIELLVQMNAFERSRSTADPDTGGSTDVVRTRFKISQAAWASRFEKSGGRHLRLEDELIRIDWDKKEERRERMLLGAQNP